MIIGNDPTGKGKLDNAATDGLTGVYGSLAYRVHEIERHIHTREKWFGLASSPSGETHRADRMAGGISPFTLTAGNDDFGSWVQILGSDDTPVEIDMEYWDAHRFIVTSTTSTNIFVVQLVAGESSGIATKIAAEEFTEVPYIAASNNNDSGISGIITRRVPAGEKIWARAACIGDNAVTISFYFGIHEYEG